MAFPSLLNRQTKNQAGTNSSETSLAEKRLARIDRVSHLLDQSFQIPGTQQRFGWDSLIGLIPGVGDVATAAMSAWLMLEAKKLGASRWVLLRMIGNTAIDLVVGIIPVAGDLFDVAWKSNRKNAELLKSSLNIDSQTNATK